MLGPWTYLTLILGWALPIIVAQWLYGWRTLLGAWRPALATVVLATAWLTIADSFALRAGTWTISPARSLGLFLPGHVPIEEAVFFLVTNTLVVQALVLLRATAPAGKERSRRAPGN